MKITDIKSLPDLINYYGAKDKDGDGKLTSKEISAYTISKYDISKDKTLSPWEVMTAVNRIHARPVFKYKDILRLRKSKRSPFPLLIKLKSATTIRGIKYKRGSVLIGKFGNVLLGVLAAKTTIQGRSFPAKTKVFFYLNGKIKAAISPVNAVFKLPNQKITVKAGSITEFYEENGRIESATSVNAMKFIFGSKLLMLDPNTRLFFDDDDENTLNLQDIADDSLAMLRHKSVGIQVKGLKQVYDLADNANNTGFAKKMRRYVWKDVATFSTQIIKAGKPPSWKLLFALKEALCALAGDELSLGSVTAWAMLNKLIRAGLQKYPQKTLALFKRTRVDLSMENRKYIIEVILKNHDWKVRLTALDYILSKSGKHIRRELLIKRFKVETNTKVLASIITSLSAFSDYKDVQRLSARVKKLALSATSDKALKKAARQLSIAIKEALKEERAEAERERKELEEERKEWEAEKKEERKKEEKPFLQGRFSGGFTGGPMLVYGRGSETGGFTASAHGSLIKGLWLSKSNKYVLSTGIELGVDPVMVHWRKGWFSFGVRSSLRLNLSNVDSKGDENWRLFIGPGYALRYSPLRDLKRVDHGVSVTAGALITYKHFIFNFVTFMMGPEFRVTHFPERGETTFTLGMKFAWQKKRRRRCE